MPETKKSSTRMKEYTYDEALASAKEYFRGDELAATVWLGKYALKDSFGHIYENSPLQMHQRIADEIARIEKECLDMFYGATTVSEEVHTFNVVLTPEKMEYVVCRFSDDAGFVAADDLSGKPIVLKVEKLSNSDFSEYLLPLGPKDKTSETYFIVPNVKCSLVGETTLLDTLLFVSTLHAKSVTARPIK